jgi:hypothetical protein
VSDPAQDGRIMAAHALARWTAAQADMRRAVLADIPDPHARAAEQAYAEAMEAVSAQYSRKAREMQDA